MKRNRFYKIILMVSTVIFLTSCQYSTVIMTTSTGLKIPVLFKKTNYQTDEDQTYCSYKCKIKKRKFTIVLKDSPDGGCLFGNIGDTLTVSKVEPKKQNRKHYNKHNH